MIRYNNYEKHYGQNIAKPSLISYSRAFTIVELVVVVALIALLSSILFTIFRGASASQTKATDDLHMQTRILATQNELLRIIREGQHFILPRLGEDSSTLCFIDKVSDIQVLMPVKDAKLSDKFDRPVYKLMHYKVDMESFNPSSPVFDPSKGRAITDYLEDVVFSLSSANSVSIMAVFTTEARQFQIMFEGGLMNAGDVE